ncbi:hypothetical protein EK21DRAFT_97622 [Setomelanomma holmii]|uniref:Uncharacterized protein n=1 Tax=Setomelanomma holmii TaxID=210430 RepID=A0A9P4LQS3_9PLEO|nr:hypothetical protein EK21DRAFT_97622 [Setomelanomma holmii]
MSLTSIFILLVTVAIRVSGQDDLGLQSGYSNVDAGYLQGTLVKSSQTLASLNSSSTNFDFLPTDFLTKLAFNGAHHLGDITFRYRGENISTWANVDSASERKPVSPINGVASNVVAAADLAPTLPTGLPLTITREWLLHDDDLAVRFNITNTGNVAVELGSLGIPISINNIFTGRMAEETQQKCSLVDPYIGLDAGYVRVTHLQGTGSALVITPLASTPFEAWHFLDEPQSNFSYRSQTFEGNYEWQVHSLAYTQNEWKNATPWNVATSKTLSSGEVYSVGLRFSVAESLQRIEEAVVRTGTPLAVGLPGYVVPLDSSSKLFLNYSSPVRSLESEGAFEVMGPSAPGAAYILTPTAFSWGRRRVTVSYEDGKTQTVHYFITKSAPATLADLGHFFTTAAHFTDTSDPFRRAPSVMTYDREVNAIVKQDPRVWIAGLSDEGGTGAYLATAMKQFAQPVAMEVVVMDDFVHDTLVGTLQQNGSFGVVASAFFYEPGAVDYSYDFSFDWTSWTSWDCARAYTTRRAYNYIHPTATYWALYPYNTTQYCLGNQAANCDYGLVGLMGEWVLGELLEDLKRESMSNEAAALEASMQYRAERWETEAVPFGSEMAWDSTGQEGVYYWTKHFNLPTTPAKALNSILAYMPTVAHWGWNGNARRYWDFVYGAKIQQIERQIHHYGSGLNSLPMLHSFESDPAHTFYNLRVGFAGNTAPLTNIDQDGFASAAMHSLPELLKWDPYSGDYGQGFLGLALGQATYIVHEAQYGDVALGGDVDETASNATVVVVWPKDAVRRRVFVAELGLKIELSAGAIQKVVFDRNAQSITLTIADSATSDALKARSAIVWLKEMGSSSTTFGVAGAQEARGGAVVDLVSGLATVHVARQ